MQKWVVSAKKADFKEIGQKFHIDQVTARLIRNRDVVGDAAIDEYLNGGISNMHDPFLLKDMDKAVKLLTEKISGQKKIRIIGDYDIDGVTSTYILYKGLLRFGAKADYDIPDRIKDGYGINLHLIQKAYEEGIDTILTCDNGISAIEQIDFAKKLGMTVIVTDHHALRSTQTEHGEQFMIPGADAVINPHQPGCPYPYKNLCGAVVAYKLVWALYQKQGTPAYDIEEFLPFAAIATVGDVMDLTGENRIIVKEGLLRLPGTLNKGLQALIRVNNLEGKKINSYHVGFVIGPCINASGRLDTAKKALQLLLTEDVKEAEELAGELLLLNNQRKEMTLEGYEEAVRQIEDNGFIRDKVLVVYLPKCHESLAGIIAGRIREKYYRPVFVLTDGEASVKGSGRSIETYSMFEEMQKCADLFLNFGGHPMAAGLSLDKENIGLLRQRLNDLTTLTEEELMEKVVIDVPMPLSYITQSLIKELDLLEPFGKGNRKPVFAEKDLQVLGARTLGQNKNVLKMQVADKYGTVMDALYFGDIEVIRSYLEKKFGFAEVEKMFQNRKSNVVLSVVYYPSINEFRGNRQIQIIIQYYR